MPTLAQREVPGGRSGSAVRKGAQSVAHPVPSTRAKRSEADAEKRLWHRSEIVEARHAVMIDPFVGSDGYAGANRTDGAGHGSHHNAVQNGYRLVTRDDQYRSPLAVRRFHEPQIALRYQGSASVIAMALAMATESSSDD